MAKVAKILRIILATGALIVSSLMLSACDPDEEQIVNGLHKAFEDYLAGDIEGLGYRGDRAEVLRRAQQCTCNASCLLATEDIFGDMIVSKFLTKVAFSVIDGAFTAIKPLTAAGKAAKAAVKKAMKEALDAGGFGLKGQCKMELKKKDHTIFHKTCEVQWVITYNPQLNQVSAVFHCNCGGKTCSYIMKYNVKSNGMATATPTVEWIK